MVKLPVPKKVLALAVVLFAVFLFFAGARAEESVEELRQRIEQRNQEIKKLEEEARKYRDEVVYSQNRGKTLKEELTRIDRTIQQYRNDIRLTERKIERTSLEIDRLNIEIKSKEHAIKKMRSGLGAMLQVLSEKDQEYIVKMLLQNGILSDFFRQIDDLTQLERRILNSLDILRDLRKELGVRKASAHEKRQELEVLDDTLRDRRKIQEVVKQDKDKVLALTKNQEKRYQELLRETEKKQEEILREIEELEEKLREKIDPGSLPEKRKGFLAWPTEGVLSQGYGETPFTKSRKGQHFYKFHNGIDIAAAAGTPIYASDDGVVLAVGDTDKYCWRGAYGKYIVVDHKNNLATMYAHLSLIKVGNGQTVKRGDIIGYMGTSGLSTGPHLHFTLYDARTVEIRKGSIGTCGLLPFGGSLNPLLYL